VDLGEAVIIAGVGCRKGATAAEIKAAIAAALQHSGFAANALTLIATAALKAREPGIAAAAAALGVRMVLVPQDGLAAAQPRAVTRSQRVRAHVGVPSVAEAAALAAGGRSARLIGARIVVGPATCALAAAGDIP
jgi:cobalt-precorrin 5A hydrolase